MEINRSNKMENNQQILSTRPQPPPALRSRNLSVCKKHPKHQQSPGVCALCLTEKLQQLSSSSSSSTTTAAAESSCSSSSPSSLSSASHYSASASSNSSPLHHRYYRMVSDGRGFSATFFKRGKNVLTKSRSVAFITRRREAGKGHETDIKDDKKKGGFWSKLLRSGRSKKIDSGGLVHSKTTNEKRMTTEVH